jgi:hypothetical protein
MAISSAQSIIDLILTDQDVREGLVGMPSYLLSMTAFTCMFLIKVSMKHGPSLADPDRVYASISRLVVDFRAIPAGKWHLVRLMAGGLEKMLVTLKQRGSSDGTPTTTAGSSKLRHALSVNSGGGPNGAMSNGANGAAFGGDNTSPFSGGIPEDYPPDWPEGAGGGMPGLDGNMFFDYNMSFGLSPVLHFDPSALGMEGQIRGV